MTDRFQPIRDALALNPTPGPWDGNDNSVSRLWSNGTAGIREYIALPDRAEDSTPNPADMHFIAACDPDTIRELLRQRDELLTLALEYREVSEYLARSDALAGDDAGARLNRLTCSRIDDVIRRAEGTRRATGANDRPHSGPSAIDAPAPTEATP